MTGLTISEVALRLGINSSAIRYYERVGLLPPPRRVSGQRRYDPAEVDRLCVIRRARQLGFTLNEVRQLCQPASEGTPIQSWRMVSKIKLARLDQEIENIKAVQHDLKRILKECRCRSIEECGKRMRKTVAQQAPEISGS